MSRRKRILVIAVVIASAVVIYGFAAVEKPPSYGFLRAAKLFDLEYTGGDRWFCYDVQQPADVVATSARRELIADGFTPTLIDSPWFRFDKPGEQVFICQMGDYAVNLGPRGGLIHMKPKTIFRHPATSIWVRRPGGSLVKIGFFQMKKFILFR